MDGVLYYSFGFGFQASGFQVKLTIFETPLINNKLNSKQKTSGFHNFDKQIKGKKLEQQMYILKCIILNISYESGFLSLTVENQLTKL